MLPLLWILGFTALLLWLVRLTRQARQRPGEIVARSRAVALALAVVMLGSASAYVWGIDVAQRGMARILGGADQQGDRASPARARLFLRNVQLFIDGRDETGAHLGTLGYSPDAALHLPRAYGLDESKRGWDLIEVSAQGPQGLTIKAIEPLEPTSTRVRVFAERRGESIPLPDEVARAATAFTGRGADRCHPSAADAQEASLDGPGAIYAILCVGRTPKAALVLERDLSVQLREDDGAPIRVSPLIWRGGRFRPHHVQIASGSLVQIGAMADALPGITIWEVPAPKGRAELFFPPDSVLASCEEWLRNQERGGRGFVSTPTLPDEQRSAPAVDDDPVCVLPFTPPFGLEVRRLLPDLPSITARSFWAAGLITSPALLLLLLLCAQRRSGITRQRLSQAAALGWLSTFMSAIAVWRLLWAHRIDMLRDYESVGVRVLQNQSLLVLAGSALAATAFGLWQQDGKLLRRLGIAVALWLCWLGLSGYALRGDLADLALDKRLSTQILLSLMTGTAVIWLPNLGSRCRSLTSQNAWSIAASSLLAVGVLALLARSAAPRAVALKLGLAWALVLIFYSALRLAIDQPRKLALTFAAGVVSAALCVAFDPGVTTAIVGPGVLLSVLLAGHDARYGEDSARRMSAFARHHAPLVIAQLALAGLLALSVAIWCVVGLASTIGGESDAVVSRSLTFGAIHLLVFFSLLFVPAAIVAARRRGYLAALPWFLASLLLASLWMAREPLIDKALGSGTQAANRVAIVVDPGYALLRSETKFLSGITAWRETIVPGESPELVDGQGYFGAQLIDPGVLLSVENDYFPVLLTREGGLQGLLSVALLFTVLVPGLWLVAGLRFRHGSGPQRRRSVAAIVLAILCVYQPLASLGVLPLTGIAWPGLGLDSPTDFWLLLILTLWIVVWRSSPDHDEALDELDRDVRASRLFRRVRIGTGAVAALLAIASLLLVSRAAAFAMRRPNPVDEAGRTVAPFDGLESALDYAYQLQCPWSEKVSSVAQELVPTDLLADPTDPGSQRFHRELRARWQEERSIAVAKIEELLSASSASSCGGHKGMAQGAWTASLQSGQLEATENATSTPADARCELRFKSGWPEVMLSVRRLEDGKALAECQVAVETSVLRQLRFPVKRPFKNVRIRLVSRAMGDAARDRGELISGRLMVRLRPGTGKTDVSTAQSGLYHGDDVRIAPHLRIELGPDGAILHREDLGEAAKSADEDEETWLFVQDPPATGVQILEAREDSWKMVPPETGQIRLSRMALLVVGGPRSRNLWLYRPPQPWGGEPASVDALLADDITTVQGERRRHYLYGGLVPELGWVNPYQERMSLGLDGWVSVALAEYEKSSAPALETRWSDEGQERSYCGPLDMPSRDDRLDRVCAPSPLDGVLQCRVSVQPELSIRLRHLTELIALEPGPFAGEKKSRSEARAPVHSSFVLLRGDTGEIVAQSEFVPGRSSSAYAPASPELEQHLVRLREDRDPQTGRKLPSQERGEASAEKLDWNRPIAVGSIMKPLLARALEKADPVFAHSLQLSGQKVAGARCANGTHALLGHCPPTDSLWNSNNVVDLATFLSESVNWFQAAIGFLGTAVPGGSWGFGKGEAELDGQFLGRNLGDHKANEALWTEFRGKRVVQPNQKTHVAALRQTAMWRNFEAILGRPLCELGNKQQCVRESARKDLCSVRALPIAAPTRDLRHLVALGPSTFDFYPPLVAKDRMLESIHTREYLQFLRGSGLHPLGSLAQLVDAFNRVIYAPDGQPLAASWFPVAGAGTTPTHDCRSANLGNTVAAGLCAVIERGTAKSLRPLLEDPRIVVYGAKTGTIDSLADIAERKEACERFQSGHTVPDQKLDAASQPYWLECQKQSRPDINDSLLVISFGVYGEDGIVPLTLGLRFQRGGLGLATHVARHYVDVIADYFAP